MGDGRWVTGVGFGAVGGSRKTKTKTSAIATSGWFGGAAGDK